MILRLLLTANRYNLVLLTGGERADLVYAAIAGLCPWIKVPHVIVDAHWQRAGGFGHLLQKLLLKLAGRIVRQVQPHSIEEVALYNGLFGIPEQKLHPIPWSTSLIGYALPKAAEEKFILTGGASFRDYGVFIEAAGEIGTPVRIGIPDCSVSDELRRHIAKFKNISLHTNWSNEEYLRQMATCQLFAMPIQTGLKRSTADQTILNAMYLGKMVIASDSIGSRIYIKDHVNGFLVCNHSAQGWKEKMTAVFETGALCRAEIMAAAKVDARIHFDETFRLARTLDAALAVVNPVHKALPATARALP